MERKSMMRSISILWTQIQRLWPCFLGNTGPMSSVISRVILIQRQIISALTRFWRNSNPTCAPLPKSMIQIWIPCLIWIQILWSILQGRILLNKFSKAGQIRSICSLEKKFSLLVWLVFQKFQKFHFYSTFSKLSFRSFGERSAEDRIHLLKLLRSGAIFSSNSGECSQENISQG